MIHVTYKRRGLRVVAATANGKGDISFGFGFTEQGALNNLINRMEAAF